jgi:hypothetical protein
MDMDNHGRESPHTLAPHIRSERFALKLDSADERLLNELNKAESDGDVLLTDLPVSQKLGTFSVICLIVNGMIGELYMCLITCAEG